MEDPVIAREIAQFTCPQCGALFADEMALDAHREQEHVEEAEGAARRPEDEHEKIGIVHAMEESGERESSEPDEHNRESPRPTEPAP